MYFIWVTASQKQFEWLLDILRTVEDVDEREIVQTHIFITQLFHQFDLRTTMLVSRLFIRLSLGAILTIAPRPSVRPASASDFLEFEKPQKL